MSPEARQLGSRRRRGPAAADHLQPATEENDRGIERGSVYISWLSDLVSPSHHARHVASNRTELPLRPGRRSQITR
jgi:hypothetical protein